MRRLIGFAIRDMWYKLGKKRRVAALLLHQKCILTACRYLFSFTQYNMVIWILIVSTILH